MSKAARVHAFVRKCFGYNLIGVHGTPDKAINVLPGLSQIV